MLAETNKLRPASFAATSESSLLDELPAKVSIEWAGSLSLELPFAGPSHAVTLGLIGGQRLLRDATARLLAAQDGLDVLGTFESVDHFLAAGPQETPAVLLLDCDGGGPGGGYRSTVELLSRHVKSGIVMLCREAREEVVRCAMEHRVSGVVLKSFSMEDVKAAIEYMASGRTVMPAGWQRAIAPSQQQRVGLSPRHREILALIARGHHNGEIANELELSPNTVKFHIRALYSRLGVRNRVEAANQHPLIANGGD